MSSASTSSRQKYLRWINSLSVQSELIDLKLFQAKAERVQKVMATLTAEGSDNTQEVKDSQQSNSSRSNESALLVNRIEYKPKPNWAVKPVPPTIERQTGPSNSIPAINEQISPEIILTIAVFKGGDYRSEVLVELDVMGSQPLTSLKDALGRHCASNHVSHSFIEGHERTAASLIKIPKDLSGFFYIEGCFYNDTRTRSFKNYSSFSPTGIFWNRINRSEENAGIQVYRIINSSELPLFIPSSSNMCTYHCFSGCEAHSRKG
ncbi:hypothetical protein BDR26DRAFT_698506 [Obelidium mucronatum]|nr:hypothetical protein BDR26DRAFT_698506 [Obelidium mucronatum]